MDEDDSNNESPLSNLSEYKEEGFWEKHLDESILTFTSDENSKQPYSHDDETLIFECVGRESRLGSTNGQESWTWIIKIVLTAVDRKAGNLNAGSSSEQAEQSINVNVTNENGIQIQI